VGGRRDGAQGARAEEAAEGGARRLREREAAATEEATRGQEARPGQGAAAAAAGGGGAAAAGAGSERAAYIRLGLRSAPSGRGRMRLQKAAPEVLTSSALEAAFADFGVRVVRVDAESALLAVTGEKRALGCVLSFHGWVDRPCDEATRAVYRRVRVVVAPVSANGRALSGPNPTMAATCKCVVACDAEGGALV